MRKPTISSLFTLNGRMSRSEYICANILVMLICFFIVVMSALLMPHLPAVNGLIVIVSLLAVFWLSYIVFTVKRLHDMNLSGWYWFLLFAWNIIVGNFRAQSPSYPFIISIVLVLPTILLILMPGTKGQNKYGRDPRDEVKNQDSSEQI